MPVRYCPSEYLVAVTGGIVARVFTWSCLADPGLVGVPLVKTDYYRTSYYRPGRNLG